LLERRISLQVNTCHRQRFLTGSDVRAALRMDIERMRQTLLFASDAWVLLPGHLHCIWTLPKLRWWAVPPLPIKGNGVFCSTNRIVRERWSPQSFMSKTW